MYVVTRTDLPAGLVVAQVTHAAVEHALRYPEVTRDAPTVVALAVPDEDHLWCTWDRLRDEGHDLTVFHEPDLDGALTALALVTDGQSRTLRRLSLLFPTRRGEEVMR